jgi:hypothetical protein
MFTIPKGCESHREGKTRGRLLSITPPEIKKYRGTNGEEGEAEAIPGPFGYWFRFEFQTEHGIVATLVNVEEYTEESDLGVLAVHRYGSWEECPEILDAEELLGQEYPLWIRRSREHGALMPVAWVRDPDWE